MRIKPRPNRAGDWMLLVPLEKYRAGWQRGKLMVRRVIAGKAEAYSCEALCFRRGLQWVQVASPEQGAA